MDLDRSRYRLALDRLALPQFAAGQAAPPFVVALEGPNAAGKSTLCRSLCGTLKASACLGTDALWAAEPLKTRMVRDADWFASAMFFLSGCFEQMRLLRGSAAPLVIMDRSLWSTLAVHAAESPERLDALLAMLRPVAAQVRVPNLTLVLEASLAACESRIAQKTGAARALDALTATAAFHGREEDFYRWLARQVPTLEFLDVERASPSEVLEKAAALIRRKVLC
ncbi:MAG: AAA family ATPase [Limisphaerales bacterium]